MQVWEVTASPGFITHSSFLCLFPQTFICFFTISIEPWRTVFQLLNKTCQEGTY